MPPSASSSATVITNDVRVVVPTLNSSSYIDVIAGYYDSQSVTATVLVDSKTSDDTTNVLRRSGFAAIHVARMPNDGGTRIGEAIEYLSRQAGTPWVLRIDDDELPSVALLRFVASAIRRDDVDAFSFTRHQCLLSRSGDLLAHVGHGADYHRQWRLYRADRVAYVRDGHSPGFRTAGLSLAAAPDSACLIHLDWVAHSYRDRREKVERYDAHTAGHGSHWRDYYLFEEAGIRGTELLRLDLPEFDETCRALSARFPDRCLDSGARGWPAGRNVPPQG